MKKIIFISLTLMTFGCQKEQLSTSSYSKPKPVIRSANSADQDIAQMKLKLEQIAKSFSKLRNIEEFDDNVLTINECKTLYPKLGFNGAEECEKWFKEVNKLSIKISRKYPDLSLNNFPSTSKSALAICQDQAVGQFTINVASCASLGLIPLAGEVLAGTCMIGALISYNSAMQSCGAINPA